MTKRFAAILTMLACASSAAVYAAPGEYWEVTTSMEMPGMPFAMPASTQKVCIPKGGENNPEASSGDKDCKVTDIRTTGNKTTWKARCNKDGEVMTGTGEQTTGTQSYQGKMRFSGKSEGQDMNMTMAYSGKRIGGSCDSEAQLRQAKSQMCDPARFDNTAEWISGADMILQPGAACADQRKQLCDMVRKDTPKDAQAYGALVMHDQQTGRNISVAKECKLDMSATTRSICKTLNGKNYSQLSTHCPAEAKRFREEQRRKDCEGRSYTAETRAADIKKCMSGQNDDNFEGREEEKPSSPRNSGKSNSGNSTQEMLDGAKKLKGLLGF